MPPGPSVTGLAPQRCYRWGILKVVGRSIILPARTHDGGSNVDNLWGVSATASQSEPSFEAYSEVGMALLAMAANLAHGGVLAGEAIVAENDAGIPLAGLAVLLAFCAGWMDLVT